MNNRGYHSCDFDADFVPDFDSDFVEGFQEIWESMGVHSDTPAFLADFAFG